MPVLLAVDDDRLTISSLLSYFRHHKHIELRTATDVATGKRALDTLPWSGLLLDYELPDGTGVDLIRHARGTRGFGPMVLLTGLTWRQVAPGVSQTGVELWFKPGTDDLLAGLALEVAAAHAERCAMSELAVAEVCGPLAGIPEQSRELALHLARGGVLESFAVAARITPGAAHAHLEALLVLARASSVEALCAALDEERRRLAGAAR